MSTAAKTPLAERLDHRAAEFDRDCTDLHVPGAVLAIVRGEEVIFPRGSGVADIEKKTAEICGRAICEVERVGLGVELVPDTFTLPPSNDSGPRK